VCGDPVTEGDGIGRIAALRNADELTVGDLLWSSLKNPKALLTQLETSIYPVFGIDGAILGLVVAFWAIFELLALARPLRGGRRHAAARRPLVEVEEISQHVVGDIGPADLHLGSAYSDRPGEELHIVLLSGKVRRDRPDL
jgi:hypothetical protein